MEVLEGAVFAFERSGPSLEEMPLAARRALDHAGLRVSLQGWRSMELEDRRRVVIAGASDRVDVSAVVSATRRAQPPAGHIDVVADPDPLTPPAGLSPALAAPRVLEPRKWARLRCVERYALAHAYRRSVARNDPSVLEQAYDDVIGVRPSIPPASAPPRIAPAPPRVPSLEVPAPRVGSSAPASVDIEPVPPLPVLDSPTSAREPDRDKLSTHLGSDGDVRMVDVGDKVPSDRRAVASGSIRMRQETVNRIARHDAPKGEVLATARVAGIMAAKRTHELIPLCHAIALTKVEVHFDVDIAGSRVGVTAVAQAHDRTGVEMEALVAVSTACLTIYDMLKGVDRDMIIGEVRLLEKSGGRSGDYRADGGKRGA